MIIRKAVLSKEYEHTLESGSLDLNVSYFICNMCEFMCVTQSLWVLILSL